MNLRDRAATLGGRCVSQVGRARGLTADKVKRRSKLSSGIKAVTLVAVAIAFAYLMLWLASLG